MKKDEYIQELADQITVFGLSAFGNQDIERRMNNDGTAHITVFGSKGFVEDIYNTEELHEVYRVAYNSVYGAGSFEKLEEKLYGQERID